MSEDATHNFNMPDESDRASAIEMALNDAAVDEIRHKSKRSQEPNKDGVYRILDCLECGDEIGGGRLTHSIKNTLCLDCAREIERINALHGR